MTTVAVTGPSTGLSYLSVSAVYGVLDALRPRRVRSGCAYGVDTAAALWARGRGADLTLVVPGAPHNERLVAGLGADCEVIQCPEESTIGASYMARNVELLADYLLVAFLWKLQFYRSGEWATVNRAKRAVLLSRLPR